MHAVDIELSGLAEASSVVQDIEIILSQIMRIKEGCISKQFWVYVVRNYLVEGNMSSHECIFSCHVCYFNREE